MAAKVKVALTEQVWEEKKKWKDGNVDGMMIVLPL